MPPIPVSKLTELALSRRKLFEKIMQHVATRKIQNSMQATGDRMTITPQQFGMQMGQQMKKAFFTLPAAAGIGAGLGAVTAPTGSVSGADDIKMRMESTGRGAVKGLSTGAGSTGGMMLGTLLAMLATRGKFRPRPPRVMGPTRAGVQNAVSHFGNSVVRGGVPGAVLGGVGGYAAADAALGKPSWEGKKASVLSVLGGLAGGGLGGLAGGAGGGILGALGGGALGGGTGAGLGLLAGGAAGLGAGAHMGGNIGANIGASFSKKKEKPESEEKEEKSEEKSEDSGDEEVKKSAAAVLAQLQKTLK